MSSPSADLPDSFDPRQPDLPTMAVDPDPLPEGYEGQDTTAQDDEGRAGGA